MVQDNYFMPDVPRILWEKRPNIPIIIGTNKDEWAFMGKLHFKNCSAILTFLELAFVAFGIKNLTTYDEGWFECEYSVLASYLNKSESVDSKSLLEAVYVPYGLAADDHLGWLKLSVSVSNYYFYSRSFTNFISTEMACP